MTNTQQPRQDMQEEIGQLIRDHLQYSRGHQVTGIDGPELEEDLMRLFDAQLKESSHRNIIVLGDLARAIGHMQGCGHPDKYLESRYPEYQEVRKGNT